ncbi:MULTISPECIES: alpha-glucuronidase [unclassified Pedobacter]|uniref:alpha-glucuronidase n=1 Tax=unclassified Pedobacter TaxID=2628915 RepID=UPI001D73133D|nr:MULTISPECIES: alpha-glucuronidase [unclassified Pedobacter]CAH0263324.1 Extracellular xylan exo-alpha-(1->2)-glucuronosidase [Pedobacter sp. Bi36]CAH0289963.1 Extracellular xylan exo-alpha-(1->2)-glucuronosidase [Pedobacter sp. Bi126]
MKKISLLLIIITATSHFLKAEDGHQLWLRHTATKQVKVVSPRKSPVLTIAVQEIKNGWLGKDGAELKFDFVKDGSITNDGFRLEGDKIVAKTDLGILYGSYELLRRQYLGKSDQNYSSNPSYSRRILNHWDNLDGSVERGYAGGSIFWRQGDSSLQLSEADIALYKEYARANASIGINGTVLNNVNASAKILTTAYLQKVQAIATVLRPYGLKVYLSVNFSSPVTVGKLKTADPLVPAVRQWWAAKAKEIYSLIPDFGGFLVKANSEGQPGPQNFERTHVDGANMMADALSPFGGIVMWRAFVYQPSNEDRTKQAYNEFLKFDGKFKKNVIIQIKNGPLDFQPREPFSPLFGAMIKTPVMPEFQITQEYLGWSNHLVFLSTLWEECLQRDTYRNGKGSTVAACTDGTLDKRTFSAIAGVSNIGLERNWTGHIFAQANWYAFGRLAWDNKLKSEDIADEWIRQTFLSPTEKKMEENLVKPIKEMMMQSREAAVDYMMPLGLHHIFAEGHHYGPAPWFANKAIRADWTSVYYHNADLLGVGFNRSSTGSNAVEQYHEPLRSTFNSLESCPEEYLLWFHHVPWTYKLKNGNDLWTSLCYRYDSGLQRVRAFQRIWDSTKGLVDDDRFKSVQSKLKIQSRDAQVWKDACLLYFQQFSKREIPYDLERPIYELDTLKKLTKSKDYE